MTLQYAMIVHLQVGTLTDVGWDKCKTQVETLQEFRLLNL